MPGMLRSLQGPFASDDPRQFEREYTPTDPTQLYPGERNYIRDTIFNTGYRTGGGTRTGDFGEGGSTYGGPRPEQEAAIASLQANRRTAAPLFDTGVDTLRRTASGEFLDPTTTAPYGRMRDAATTYARDLFSGMADDVDSNAAARGIYDSSTRRAQRNRAAERVTHDTSNRLEQAAFQQYGAERTAQQQASVLGAELEPSLSKAIFSAGETLRAAEQSGEKDRQANDLARGVAQMESYLKQRGLDQNTISQMIDYMRMVTGQILPSVVGQSDLQANRQNFNDAVGAFGTVAGAGGRGGGGGGGGSSGAPSYFGSSMLQGSDPGGSRGTGAALSASLQRGEVPRAEVQTYLQQRGLDQSAIDQILELDPATQRRIIQYLMEQGGEGRGGEGEGTNAAGGQGYGGNQGVDMDPGGGIGGGEGGYGHDPGGDTGSI